MAPLHPTTADLTEASRASRRAGDAEPPRSVRRIGEDHSRLREEFVALASHELMTPVTSLVLGTELMKRELARTPGDAPERVTAVLDVFDRQLTRLAMLCDELVQATHLQVGAPELTLQDVDLAELVGRVVHRLSTHVPATARLISLEAEPGLVGRWDVEQLERVVLHLVKNALTFGEGKPVTVEVRRTPEGAQVAVRDQGMGIAREDHERIFGRFQRAASSDNFGGLGLGLYIARAVVQAHGGAIRVDSELGRGATFTVDLPIASEPAVQRAA